MGEVLMGSPQDNRRLMIYSVAYGESSTCPVLDAHAIKLEAVSHLP
jgi:hypothetical protein